MGTTPEPREEFPDTVTLHCSHCSYIEYETQIEKLRKLRKKAQGEDAVHGEADTAGIKRLHFIYTRALRKFKGDLRLWSKYFQFCKKEKAPRALDKAITQALQFHPTVPGLWAYAASWWVVLHTL